MANKGYVSAEEVIGVRVPVYDEDLVAEDFRRHFGPRRLHDGLGGSSESIGMYEAASGRMIEDGLRELR
jgi:hypothetical protein